MRYEIINPSDPYTMESDCPEAAALALCILNPSGTYGLDAETLKPEDGFPFLMFQKDVEAWWVERYGHDIKTSMRLHRDGVIKALRSVLYGDLGQRAIYEKTLALIDDPEKRKVFTAQWQDRRGSMNNIGGAAHSIADQLEAKAIAEAGEAAANA